MPGQHDPPAMMTTRAAAAHLGCSSHLIGRRAAEGQLPRYADPLDRRRRLVAVADVERLLTSRPVAAPRAESEGAA